MSEKTFPSFDHYYNFSIWLAANDAESQAEAAAKIDDNGTVAFLAAHPEYHCSDFNAQLHGAWLKLHGGLPFTKWNLEIAFRDLSEDGLLETAPTPAAPEADQSRGIKQEISDALAEYVPDDAEAAALDKVKDDPSLSDHARKQRDHKLALLAGRQRRAFSDLPQGTDPRIQV